MIIEPIRNPLTHEPIRTFIDHRHSLARALDRPDAPTCQHCQCLLDEPYPAHSPRCRR